MNKRLIKKKIKKSQDFHGVINAYGNNGGDILEIFDNCDGTINLRSGSCCVTSIDKTVPVEFLTAIISRIMIEYNGDINLIIDSFGWDNEFKSELKAKVK